MLESTGGYSRRTTEALKHAKSEDLNHNLVAALVHHIHTHEDEEGAILVFLPGWEDINKVNTLLTQSRFQLFYAKIFPLHSLTHTYFPTSHRSRNIPFDRSLGKPRSRTLEWTGDDPKKQQPRLDWQ